MGAFSYGFNNGFKFGMFNSLLGGGWCNSFANPFVGWGCIPFNHFGFGGGFFNPFGHGFNSFNCWNPTQMFMVPRYNFNNFSIYHQPTGMQTPVFCNSPMRQQSSWQNYNYSALSSNTHMDIGDSFIKTKTSPSETKINIENKSVVTRKEVKKEKVISDEIMAKTGLTMTDNERLLVYGEYTRDITKTYEGNAIALNKKLENRGILKNKGQDFIDAQAKYGINAAVLAAICIQETGGISDNATKRYNVGNIAKGKGWQSYKSVREGIFAVAKLLKEKYANQGFKKLYQVNSIYCPVQDTRGSEESQRAWASKIENITSSIEKIAV